MIARYSSKSIEQIWSDRNKYDIWLKIELLVCEALFLHGIIPEDDYNKIRDVKTPNIRDIECVETVTRHDVAAFVQVISSSLGNSGRWIHYGLTASDIVDTGNAVRFQQANRVIKNNANNLLHTLKEMACQYKHTVCIGRTHGMHAEITTFGMKLAVCFDDIRRSLARFTESSKGIEAGKISGAVGTFASIPITVQDYVCTKLEIESSRITTQIVQRGIYADYFSSLALIATSIEKCATNLRQLQSTEIDEIRELFSKSQQGSSSMPHKRNPIRLENLCGCARVMRGYMMTAYENVCSWQESDISHSSVERIISPDATVLLDYMITSFVSILDNLVVREDAMQRNTEKSYGVVFSQAVALKLIENGLLRTTAFDLLQECSCEALANKKHLYEIAKSNSIISTTLKDSELKQCFDINNQLKHVGEVLDRLWDE